jgi:hypothetical protein
LEYVRASAAFHTRPAPALGRIALALIARMEQDLFMPRQRLNERECALYQVLSRDPFDGSDLHNSSGRNLRMSFTADGFLSRIISYKYGQYSVA